MRFKFVLHILMVAFLFSGCCYLRDLIKTDESASIYIPSEYYGENMKPEWEKAVAITNSLFAGINPEGRSFKRLYINIDTILVVEYIPIRDNPYIVGGGAQYQICLTSLRVVKAWRYQ